MNGIPEELNVKLNKERGNKGGRPKTPYAPEAARHGKAEHA